MIGLSYYVSIYNLLMQSILMAKIDILYDSVYFKLSLFKN